jgi:hypothetical protein
VIKKYQHRIRTATIKGAIEVLNRQGKRINRFGKKQLRLSSHRILLSVE